MLDFNFKLFYQIALLIPPLHLNVKRVLKMRHQEDFSVNVGN
jgi:hypothetical protein